MSAATQAGSSLAVDHHSVVAVAAFPSAKPHPIADNDNCVAPSASSSRFLVYAAVSAAVLPVRPPIRPLTIALNTLILGVYALLIYADRPRRSELLSVIRDWFPCSSSCWRIAKWDGSRFPCASIRSRCGGWNGIAWSCAAARAG